MAFSFRGIFRRLIPWWLLEGDGERHHFALSTMVDAIAERVRLGIRARFPADAPEDALAHLGRDAKIVRGFAESSDNYRARLPGALDAWRTAGGPWALMRQMLGYTGYLDGGMKIRTVDNRGNWYLTGLDGVESYDLDVGNWDWDGQPDKWARFWLIMEPPGALWAEGPTIGDPDLWGGAIGTAGYTIGSTATPEQVAAVKALVREWKPAGTRAMRVILSFDNADLLPGSVAPESPDGTWHLPSSRMIVTNGGFMNSNLCCWDPNT